MTQAAASLAFVFPGQGSQSVGMLAELAAAHPEVKATFDEASQGAGVNLWALSQHGPEDVSAQAAGGESGHEDVRVETDFHDTSRNTSSSVR